MDSRHWFSLINFYNTAQIRHCSKKVKNAIFYYNEPWAEGEALMKEERRLEERAHENKIPKNRPTLGSFMGDAFENISDEIDELDEKRSFSQKLLLKNDAIRSRLRTLVKSPVWFWTVLILVLINTGLRCSVHHGMPEWWKNLLEQLEITFLIIFSLEITLKMYAVGSERYFKAG